MAAPSRLETLWLYGNPVGDAGAWLLASSETVMSRLREVNLAGCGLSDHGARAFLVSPWSEGLERLIRDPGLRADLGRAGEERLRRDFALGPNIAGLAKLFGLTAREDAA